MRRYPFISNLLLLATQLLKNNKNLKVLVLAFTIHTLTGSAQTLIPGTINTSSTIPNVERNFVGFNSGLGNLESIYNVNKSSAGLEVNSVFHTTFAQVSNKIFWRFPGGTTSSYYNRWGSGYGNAGAAQLFGENSSFLNLNLDIRDNLYKTYTSFTNAAYPSAKSNIIFPFINSITKNKTTTANGVYCLNIVSHYRNVPGSILYDTRMETLKDTNKIKAITGMDAFNRSTLSAEFKKIVRQNIDGILTLVGNGVSIYKVELGNELYGYQYNDNSLLNYTAFTSNIGPNITFFPSDTKVWLKDDGSAQSIKESYTSLWAFAHLAKMYRTLMRDTLQKLAAAQPGNATYANHVTNIKFGVPVTPILNSGFKKWDEFLRQPNVRSYVGIDAYIVHPYFDSTNYFKGYNLSTITNSSVTDLAREFNVIRDTMEIAYNNRFFKKNHVNMINALPAGSELWYTEWDFNFDNSKLMKVGNTLLHAMFYQDAMMNFFDINANKNLQVSLNKTNVLKLCNYHIPYAKTITWYPMMRFTNGYATTYADPYTTTNSVPNSVEYNSTFYAHNLLMHVLGDDAAAYVNANNGGFNAMTNCTFRSFVKKQTTGTCTKNIVYIYFNNKSQNNYSINLNQALNITNALCVKATKSYLYANNLYASMGATTFRTNDILTTNADVTIQRVFNQSVPGAQFGAVSIPKYSMGYIKAEITIPTATCSCTGAGSRVANPEEEEIQIAETPLVRIYPNPVTEGSVNIEVTSPTEMQTQVRIFDLAGSQIRSFMQPLASGNNLFRIDLSYLSKSVYIIRMDGDNLRFTEKVIVQ